MSTLFLFQDLRCEFIAELHESSQLNCLASDQGEKGILLCIFIVLFLQHCPFSLCPEVRRKVMQWSELLGFPACDPLSWASPLSSGSVRACCGNASISLDIAGQTQLLHVQSRPSFLWSFIGFRFVPHHTSLGIIWGSANCRWVDPSLNSLPDFSSQTWICFPELFSQVTTPRGFKWCFLIAL